MDERKRTALEVAYLLTQEPNLTQVEIKDRLGLGSQTEVSRSITYAKKERLLRWTVAWPDSQGETQQIIDRVNGRLFPQRRSLERNISNLAKDRTGIVPKLAVIYDVGLGVDEAGRRENFGRHAAEYVWGFTKDADTCAVAWGRTIQSLVDGSSATDHPLDITFVPMAGEPLINRSQGLSSSAAVRVLTEKFCAPGRRALSLDGVPVRIPKELNDEAGVIRRFINKSDDYQKIFGIPGVSAGLIENVAMIISGVGDMMTSESDAWFREMQAMEGGLELSLFSDGNLGGVWLPRDPTNEEHRSAVSEINSRWLGIQEENFRACAKRADRSDAPGVFLLAIEEEKVKGVANAIGHVNHLVITQSLALALHKLLSVDQSDPRKIQ